VKERVLPLEAVGQHGEGDLYRWAHQLVPVVPRDVIDCFELARDIRSLGLRR
jgi:hypothetical protein